MGLTHSLRSDLWWVMPFRFNLVIFGIPFGSHTIKPALARHTGVQVSLVPAKVITWSPMPINIGTYHIQPTGVHGLCFGYCFSGPLPLSSLILGPLSRVHFGESLVVRLYSEIDHTYLSIEAQSVSHHYPRWTATNHNSIWIRLHNHSAPFSKSHAKYHEKQLQSWIQPIFITIKPPSHALIHSMPAYWHLKCYFYLSAWYYIILRINQIIWVPLIKALISSSISWSIINVQ